VRQCPKCGSEYADSISFCPNDGTATRPREGSGGRADRDSFIGVVIDGRYRIDARVGEGGMGVVYRATHLVLKKLFAIKVMRGDQAHDPAIVQRFLQEARASSAIGHPNIVNISDFGTTGDGAVYFAMEFLQGQTLAQAMDAGPLERGRALDIFAQIASALEAAHEAGIVHRDLKPENIFLKREPDNHDFVKVLDFGIAKVKNLSAKLTRTGMVFGTPHYMSPEQAAGQPVDHRSDIYSLGVIMYQVFTGQLPFDGDSFMDVMTKHMYEPVPPPNRPGLELPPALEAIVLRALQKKPEQRQQTMRELRDELQNVRLGQPAMSPLPSSVALAPNEPVRLSPQPERSAPATSTTLEAAARRALADEDEVPIAVPKSQRLWWVWLLIAGVLVGILALSLRGGRSAATVATPEAAVPDAAPPPSVTEAPPPSVAEAPPPEIEPERREPEAARRERSTREQPPAEPAHPRQAKPAKPVAPVAKPANPKPKETIDPWR
jgi:serine/threonine-protein kinase